MTEFEKEVSAKVNAAKNEGEEDIRQKIVEELKKEFLNLIPTYIHPNEKLNPLVAETIWINCAGYKESERQYKLIFARKEMFFSKYEDVEKFAKEIMKLFPSENIDCHILNALEWNNTHTTGSRAFGLEFSFKFNEKM